MSAYEDHRNRQSASARKDYASWVKSLSPEQRRNLERLNVLSPAKDDFEVGGHSPYQPGDASESNYSRADEIPIEEDPACEMADDYGIPLATARAILKWHQSAVKEQLLSHESDMLSIVVGGLISSRNVRIAAGALAFATNMAALNGLGSLTDYAKQLGVTKSIISKAMKQWKTSLGLPSTCYQKSAEACKTYSEVGTKNHWRFQKVTASSLMTRLTKLRSTNKPTN